MIANLVIILIAILTLVCVIGYAIGDMSDKQRLEELKANRSNQQYQEWLNELEKFHQSINGELGYGVDFDPGDRFDQLWKLEEVSSENRYIEGFKTVLNNMEEAYRSVINETLPHLQGIHSLPLVLSLLKCLRALNKNDERFEPAIDALKSFMDYAEKETYLVNFSEYGVCDFKFDNVTDFAKFDEETEALKEKIADWIVDMRQDLGKYYENIPRLFTPEYIDLTCELLWRTAVRKPFNQEYFKLARGFFGSYTIRCFVGDRYELNSYAAECKKNGVKERIIRAEKVEYWLALIYAKNQIGGHNTVIQEKENILNWVRDMAYIGR